MHTTSKQTAVRQTPQSPWMDVDEAAAYLKVGRRAIYTAAARKQLRVARLGRTIRCRQDWLDSWAEQTSEQRSQS